MNITPERLTPEDRNAMARVWPDWWQVHAAVERIVAERVAAAKAEALRAVAELAGVDDDLATDIALGGADFVRQWLRDRADRIEGQR